MLSGCHTPTTPGNIVLPCLIRVGWPLANRRCTMPRVSLRNRNFSMSWLLGFHNQQNLHATHLETSHPKHMHTETHAHTHAHKHTPPRQFFFDATPLLRCVTRKVGSFWRNVGLSHTSPNKRFRPDVSCDGLARPGNPKIRTISPSFTQLN